MRETLPVPHVCIRQLFGPSDPPHLNWITHQGKCVPKIDRRDKNGAFGKLRAFFWSSDLHRKRTCNRLSTHVWSEPDITFNVWGSQSPKTAENQAFPKTNRVSLLGQPVISYSGKREDKLGWTDNDSSFLQFGQRAWSLSSYYQYISVALCSTSMQYIGLRVESSEYLPKS